MKLCSFVDMVSLPASHNCAGIWEMYPSEYPSAACRATTALHTQGRSPVGLLRTAALALR